LARVTRIEAFLPVKTPGKYLPGKTVEPFDMRSFRHAQ